MRIFDAEAGENDFKAIRLPIAVAVDVAAEVRSVLDDDAVLAGKDAQWNGEAICERAGGGRFLAPPIAEHENLIFSTGLVEARGVLWVFVGVDRIFEGGHGPHPSAGVPVNGDEFSDAVGFCGNELGFEPLG